MAGMNPPLHRKIADDLREQIRGGTLGRGDALPSESALAAQYGLSRTTVRAALSALTNEGLIETSSGRPARVRSGRRWTWPMSTWERAHNSIEDAWASSVREQGGEPSTVVTVQVEQASTEVSAALEVDEGSNVVTRRRIRSVDGEPHQLADSWFPYWLAEEHPVFLQPGDVHAPGGLLGDAGLTQTRLLDSLTARMPTPDELRLLNMSAGTPLLIHHRTGYTSDGRAVRYMVTRMAADRVDLTWELTP